MDSRYLVWQLVYVYGGQPRGIIDLVNLASTCRDTQVAFEESSAWFAAAEQVCCPRSSVAASLAEVRAFASIYRSQRLLNGVFQESVSTTQMKSFRAELYRRLNIGPCRAVPIVDLVVRRKGRHHQQRRYTLRPFLAQIVDARGPWSIQAPRHAYVYHRQQSVSDLEFFGMLLFLAVFACLVLLVSLTRARGN